MEKPTDLETKYQRLAAEYSKIRSHVTVLKKAVIDEQSKVLELKETIKEQDLKTRKHDQEMESLTFRNDQLTKRITVLQQELQVNHSTKKGKSKAPETQVQPNISVLDEELHKKILENATLVSTMADKDLELANSKDRIEHLEEEISNLQHKFAEMEVKHKEELRNAKADYANKSSVQKSPIIKKDISDKLAEANENMITHWKQEAEKWKSECEFLRIKPKENEELEDFYTSQIKQLIESKQMAMSEAGILWADNNSLQVRLEHLILEKNALESILEKSNEELHTTSQNYKQQLDAMTEHIAMQNERITKLSDEVEILKHKLSTRK